MEDLRLQEPSNPNNWLYEEVSSNERNFALNVYLGKDAEPWHECTNAEKIAWEEAHRVAEPIEPIEQ